MEVIAKYREKAEENRMAANIAKWLAIAFFLGARMMGFQSFMVNLWEALSYITFGFIYLYEKAFASWNDYAADLLENE